MSISIIKEQLSFVMRNIKLKKRRGVIQEKYYLESSKQFLLISLFQFFLTKLLITSMFLYYSLLTIQILFCKLIKVVCQTGWISENYVRRKVHSVGQI